MTRCMTGRITRRRLLIGGGVGAGFLAQVRVGADGGVMVDRIAAAVDCGRMINPDLVSQQIDGGIRPHFLPPSAAA